MKVGAGVDVSVAVAGIELGGRRVAVREGVAVNVGIGVAGWQAVRRSSPIKSVFFIVILL